MLRTTLPADGEEVLPAPAPDHASDRASDLERLAALAGRHHLEGIEQRAETARLQARDDVVSVAVLGRFKAGKTSMLNQLLGEDLLPVQAIPATAVITRLSSGPRLTVRVFPTAGDAFAIGPAQLADWTTESGNPDNVRQVEWVQVESPALADLDHLDDAACRGRQPDRQPAAGDDEQAVRHRVLVEQGFALAQHDHRAVVGERRDLALAQWLEQLAVGQRALDGQVGCRWSHVAPLV